MQSVCRIVLYSARRRCLHTTPVSRAIIKLGMPAMSPTMTEGGIAEWKKQAGESFSVGDVLLEIETDKATIDVEAPEDGIMGKILVPNGTKNIPIGTTIALLAEEGDDISNLEVPKDAQAPPSPPKRESSTSAAPSAPSPGPGKQPQTSTSASYPTHHPEHPRPLFPSVLRLLEENSKAIPRPTDIKGTGVRGMLTKGDVLAFLGKASGPLGTFKEPVAEKAVGKKEVPIPPLDSASLRRLIVGNMLNASIKARSLAVVSPPADFDSIISDYLPRAVSSKSPPVTERTTPPKASPNFLDGLI